MRRPSRFAVVLFSITVLVQCGLAPVWFRLGRLLGDVWLRGSGSLPSYALSVAAPLLLSALLIYRLRRGLWDEKRSEWSVWLLDIPVYIHFSASLLAVLLLPVGSLALWAASVLVSIPDRVWDAVVLGSYGLSLSIAAYGTLVRRRNFVVLEENVELKNWPSALDGFRIAQLSDLHVGSLTPRRWNERWIEAANASRPDLVVVTGDLVTSGDAFHEDIAELVGKLNAPLGVFVVMGNHDYFGGGEPLLTLLRARGARVLRNEAEIVTKNGGEFLLAGVDDTWTRRANLAAALEQKVDGRATILLAHDPVLFPEAAKAGVDLTLSGHTHGGQIAFPWLAHRWSLAHLSHSHVVGAYEEEGGVLYVHPGLGTTGPPIRFGVAPAVVIHNVRRAR